MLRSVRRMTERAKSRAALRELTPGDTKRGERGTSSCSPLLHFSSWEMCSKSMRLTMRLGLVLDNSAPNRTSSSWMVEIMSRICVFTVNVLARPSAALDSSKLPQASMRRLDLETFSPDNRRVLPRSPFLVDVISLILLPAPSFSGRVFFPFSPNFKTPSGTNSFRTCRERIDYFCESSLAKGLEINHRL